MKSRTVFSPGPKQKLSNTPHEPSMPFKAAGYAGASDSNSLLVRVLIHRRNLAC